MLKREREELGPHSVPLKNNPKIPQLCLREIKNVEECKRKIVNIVRKRRNQWAQWIFIMPRQKTHSDH